MISPSVVGVKGPTGFERHGTLDNDRIKPISLCLIEALGDFNVAGYPYRDLDLQHAIHRDQHQLRLLDLGLVVPYPRGKLVRNPSCDGTWETMALEEF